MEKVGDCLLFLGDCLSILPTLGKIESIVTDPPYGIDFQSNYREIRHSKIENDNSEELLKWVCNIEVCHSKYIFCRWDNMNNIPKPKSLIKWIKNNWSMGDLEHEHARQTEEIAFYPGDGHFWPHKRPVDVIYGEKTGNHHHPTEKPVDLISRVIKWTNGVVIDPFMGSGTTGVACAKLGRKFIGIEINEEYYKIARKRIIEAYLQPSLFIEEPPKPIQEKLL